ncbi:PH domain-containing protein [Pseudolysinimonas sp.]|uniref:PH domain-containing protein n=1 Tax=Pseudolysinimonas sp. TaxID=2680009 RepID=UPI0037850A7E
MSTPHGPDAAEPPTAGSPPNRAALDPVAGEWQRVSPKYVVVDLLGILVSTVLFVVGSGVPWLLSGVPWLVVLPIGALVLHLLIAAFTPRRVRALGYLLRDDDLVFRKGIMFLRIVSVPYGRMQLVDLNRGPIARAFGLSELKLVTAAAASHITIPGLPEADAESLRDRLVELAESRRAGL